jgi:hypothetical protein
MHLPSEHPFCGSFDHVAILGPGIALYVELEQASIGDIRSKYRILSVIRLNLPRKSFHEIISWCGITGTLPTTSIANNTLEMKRAPFLIQ